MENWKPVIGFEGFYEVSDLGNVRSVERIESGIFGKSKRMTSRKVGGRTLSAYRNMHRGGYNYVNLRKNKIQHMRRVARLVAAAFIGECPEGHQVCHKNGIGHDDRAENLRYDTPYNNSQDKYTHGTVKFGMEVSNCKISDSDVALIRASKDSPVLLGARFGVHPRHITNIRCGLKRFSRKGPHHPQTT